MGRAIEVFQEAISMLDAEGLDRDHITSGMGYSLSTFCNFHLSPEVMLEPGDRMGIANVGIKAVMDGIFNRFKEIAEAKKSNAADSSAHRINGGSS